MYMYKKLKEALGLPGSTSGSINNWTPNNIKSIIVMRDFILIAHHLSVPRLVMLDVSESVQDIQRNGVQGSLHNLLSQRQLSCLEEIYVDSVFQNYRGILDLDKYVSSLVNSASRLRYYGYAENLQSQEVYNCYSNCIVKSLMEYTYALDSARSSVLQYRSTENSDWYKKYNLRPDKYRMDGDNGSLSMRLKLIERSVESRKAKELETLAAQGVSSALSSLYKIDLGYASDLMLLLKLKKSLDTNRVKNDEVARKVKSTIVESLKKLGNIKVNIKDLQTSLGQAGIKIQPKSKEDFILNYYSTTRILTSDVQNYDLTELLGLVKNREGLLALPSLLERICVKLFEQPKNASDTLMLSAYVLLELEEVEQSGGDLKLLFSQVREKADCCTWYITFLLGLCGYNSSTVGR